MRNTFINTLSELAEINQNIFLLCGDLGYSVLEPFAEKFPDRYLNVGISEQNMTEVAVGLSLEGYNVFTYSIGNFPTLRCMEQIRYDVCYHNANVKIVSVGSGYAYGPLGVSHHTTEDISMLRSIPNMVICAPSDPVEAKAVANFVSNHQGPGYVRLNKSGESCIHDANEKLILSPGEFLKIRDGEDCAVIVVGAILSQILQELEQLNLPWAVYSSPFVGSYDPKYIISLVNNFGSFVTVEENQLNGGFGSSFIEQLSDMYHAGEISFMPKVGRLGIKNKFIGFSGGQVYLREAAGISIKNSILSVCAGYCGGK